MRNEALINIEQLPYFTNKALKTSLNIDGKTQEQWVWRKIKNKTLIPLKKGLYVTSSYANTHKSPTYNEYLASVLKYPSYLSSTYVLGKYDLLIEAPMGITSITMKMGRTYSNKFGDYRYQTVQKRLFTGYQTALYEDKEYLVATKSKALFDYLYLKTSLTIDIIQKVSIAEELRIRTSEMDENDWKEFEKYTKLFKAKNSRMKLIYENLKRNASNNL